MDFEFLAGLGWREVLVALVVLLVLYIVFALLRINRLRHEASRAQELPSRAAQEAVSAYAAVQTPDVEINRLSEPLPERVPTLLDEQVPLPFPAREEPFVWNAPVQERADAQRIATLEEDLAGLRREIGHLRAELAGLRDARQREMNQAQVLQDVSPYYGDAMQQALQGKAAAEISVLCGISRAEAELVVALARNSEGSLE